MQIDPNINMHVTLFETGFKTSFNMIGVGKKNFGPCSITNCTNEDISFRLITELAYQKCCNNNILETYPYLEVGKQLCHLHYCNIVEPNRGQKQKRIKNQECSRKKVKHVEETRKEGNIIDIN